MRAWPRQAVTADPRFVDSSQNAPAAPRDNVISITALTATRPARRRSRNASLTRKPST